MGSTGNIRIYWGIHKVQMNQRYTNYKRYGKYKSAKGQQRIEMMETQWNDMK